MLGQSNMSQCAVASMPCGHKNQNQESIKKPEIYIYTTKVTPLLLRYFIGITAPILQNVDITSAIPDEQPVSQTALHCHEKGDP